MEREKKMLYFLHLIRLFSYWSHPISFLFFFSLALLLPYQVIFFFTQIGSTFYIHRFLVKIVVYLCSFRYYNRIIFSNKKNKSSIK